MKQSVWHAVDSWRGGMSKLCFFSFLEKNIYVFIEKLPLNLLLYLANGVYSDFPKHNIFRS